MISEKLLVKSLLDILPLTYLPLTLNIIISMIIILNQNTIHIGKTPLEIQLTLNLEALKHL